MLGKYKIAAVAVAAVSVLAAFSSSAGVFGDYEVKMYSYIESSDAYMLSEVPDKAISGVVDNGDGSYTISFQPIEMGSIYGYLSYIETVENGECETSENGYVDFTYYPNDIVFDTVDKNGRITEDGDSGTLIDFTVTLAMGTHSISQGALSVTPAD